VKGIQEKLGKDKLQVVLLSVDCGYGMDPKRAMEADLKSMTKQGVQHWTNVVLPNGMKDTARMFNLDGYGLTLVDPDGIVRGIDIYGGEVEALLSKGARK
jgi:hypothetical protein